ATGGPTSSREPSTRALSTKPGTTGDASETPLSRRRPTRNFKLAGRRPSPSSPARSSGETFSRSSKQPAGSSARFGRERSGSAAPFLSTSGSSGAIDDRRRVRGSDRDRSTRDRGRSARRRNLARRQREARTSLLVLVRRVPRLRRAPHRSSRGRRGRTALVRASPSVDSGEHPLRRSATDNVTSPP